MARWPTLIHPVTPPLLSVLSAHVAISLISVLTTVSVSCNTSRQEFLEAVVPIHRGKALSARSFVQMVNVTSLP